MKKIYLYVQLVLLLVLSSAVYAQQKVSGTVTDENGEVLVGVSIVEKGTTNGTISDVNGKYQISLNNEDPTLLYSFIGYLTQEEPVNNRSLIDVTLKEDVAELQEIVVVGYGTQKKVNLSGAVDQVDAKTIEKRPISNLSQGLQGAVPNLNIDFNSGEPGAAANINIRGITSINGGNPLILIDGVPSDSYELNRISPQDVESISVLKDASSAAIYGARAAFGVIIITTKSGSKEGIQINYSNNFSWDKPTILPEKVTDPYIFSRVLETSTDNTPWDYVNYSDEYYQWARERSNDPSVAGVRINPNDETQWEYMGNRDWTNYFLGDYSFSQNHQLSVGGGSEKTKYYVSGNYNRQNGALKIADDYFDRFGFRSKVDFQPYKWLTVGNNTFLTSTKREKPYFLDIGELYNFFPTDMDKNPDGTWANTSVGIAGARLNDGGDYSEIYNSLQSRFTAQLSFWERIFTVNTDFTYRRGVYNYASNTKKYNVGYGPDDVREIGNNWARKEATFQNYNVFNVYGTFDKFFGEHHVTATAGFNQEDFKSDNFYASRDQVISPSLPSISLATGEMVVGDTIGDWAIRGAFYRLNYMFKDKYIVELNGRYDGSSKFPKDKRFGFFPSASAAWRVDQEKFFGPLTSTVSLFKLRASYGELGNQFVGEYGYISSMQATPAGVMFGDNRPVQVNAPQLVSPNYTWEQVSTLNFGVDLGLFTNKIMATFDIYQRDTKGMLIPGRDLPNVLGAIEPNENAGDLETKGWEVSLSYSDELAVSGKPLSLNAKFVLSDSRSYITRFDNPSNSLFQYYEGMELGEIWGLESDGFFQNEDEIAALDETSLIPWGALNIVPGWPKYVDQDGNGVIEKGYTLEDTKDLKKIGNYAPRLRYGLNLSMNWNGFDLSAFIQGVAKRDYYPLDYLYWGFYQQPYAGGYVHTLDYYRPTADSEVDMAKHSQAYIDAGLAEANLDSKFPVLQSWLADRNLGERIDQRQGLAIPQTKYLLNAAYLRLKNITLGYTLPQPVTEKLHLQNVRVFVSGENLTEWSALKDYFDPEAINANNNYNPGVTDSGRGENKGYSYPFQRRYAFGINVTF